MDSMRFFTPVKLFIGVLLADEEQIAPIRDRLVATCGAIDRESPVMAAGFGRVFFSFERLIEAGQLENINRRTNEIAEETGYVENATVVLASTKDFYHRIYHFQHDAFQFGLEADSGLNNYQSFFQEIRHIYRSQLRTMCLLKREEKP